jgi:polar amino acid transport system substrate-binding protein
MEIRDPGVNLLEGHRPKTSRSERPLTQMVIRALELKRNMVEAGQNTGQSKIEVDMKGYRDYRGTKVFGAWLWNVDLGIGLAAEIDTKEALSTYHMIRLTVVGMLGFTLFMSVAGTLFILMIGERANKALTRSRDELEKRVDERTAELKDNQEQLTAAEERSRLILDSAGEGIFGVNIEGICTFANPAALNMLGYASEEILGKSIHSQIHHTHSDGSHYPERTCPMFKAYSQGISETISSEMLWRKDGTGFPVEYTATPVLRSTEITGAVITFRDITERKLMEDAIADERARLQKILDTSPVGVMISTEDTIRFTNPRMTELTNLNEGDPANKVYVNAEERRHVVEGVMKNGVVRDYELQAYRPDHKICDILGTFMNTEYDGKTGILGWLVDITQMKKAEKELRQRFDELARFRRLAVGREKKMIDLKMEINELLKNSGLPEKYKIH